MDRKTSTDSVRNFMPKIAPNATFIAYEGIPLDELNLIRAAVSVIQKQYRKSRHTVGCAILCDSNEIYAGVNIDSCGYGPCAEPIAVGMAISNGERLFKKIVAVRHSGLVMSPCGNCRQLLLDYAPDIEVLVPYGETVVCASISQLLPSPHRNFP